MTDILQVICLKVIVIILGNKYKFKSQLFKGSSFEGEFIIIHGSVLEQVNFIAKPIYIMTPAVL